MVRVEGFDRKSFFAIAESPNGVDNFRFWERPVNLPDIDPEETNVYDMRLTAHEDGWIYGIFCSERHDRTAALGDLSSAVAKAGIVRTKNLIDWERLPDLKSKSQQRNVVLHPEFVDGKYALYTRPQDGFIDAGSGGGIGWSLIDDITNASILSEQIIDKRHYHTIKEVKMCIRDRIKTVRLALPVKIFRQEQMQSELVPLKNKALLVLCKNTHWFLCLPALCIDVYKRQSFCFSC